MMTEGAMLVLLDYWRPCRQRGWRQRRVKEKDAKAKRWMTMIGSTDLRGRNSPQLCRSVIVFILQNITESELSHRCAVSQSFTATIWPRTQELTIADGSRQQIYTQQWKRSRWRNPRQYRIWGAPVPCHQSAIKVPSTPCLSSPPHSLHMALS